MHVMIIASAIVLAMLQNAAATSARSALVDCLRTASAEAKKGKVAPDAVAAHMKQACGAQHGALKSALVAFDVKNGISRKQASADADLQLEDYYATQEEKYRFLLERESKTETASSN